jgi:dipeptidase
MLAIDSVFRLEKPREATRHGAGKPTPSIGTPKVAPPASELNEAAVRIATWSSGSEQNDAEGSDENCQKAEGITDATNREETN